MLRRRVRVLTKAGCVWCDRVAELLADRGIPFTKESPSLDHLRSELAKLGVTTVPQVFVDGEHIGGFKETKAWLAEVMDDGRARHEHLKESCHA
jgi:glutaredoxin